MRNSSRIDRIKQELRSIRQWLTPGMGVKRWLLLVILGTALIGAGLAVLVLDVYRSSPDTWWLPILSWASLRFLSRPVRALIFGSLGLGLIAGGIIGFNRSLMAPYLRPDRKLVETLSDYRRRDKGPRIAVIGGGHGLSTLLRGLKAYTSRLTAIVTVADDGGSSGRLRDSKGILPPGDMRNCLAALSNDEDLITQLFQYRFAQAGDELGGHSFGNLLITALTEITGSFEEAIEESGRVLSINGKVLPSTLHNVRLEADLSVPVVKREVRIRGESRIATVPGSVRRIWLQPNNPPAYPAAVQTLLNADLIVLGPGSLYTSLLPNLLVPDIASAIKSSTALKIFVCNIVTQPGETDGFTCGDHIRAIEAHVGKNFFDMVISNQDCQGELPENISWVKSEDGLEDQYPLYKGSLANEEKPGQHDAEKLAKILINLLQERTGPLVL